MQVMKEVKAMEYDFILKRPFINDTSDVSSWF